MADVFMAPFRRFGKEIAFFTLIYLAITLVFKALYARLQEHCLPILQPILLPLAREINCKKKQRIIRVFCQPLFLQRIAHSGICLSSRLFIVLIVNCSIVLLEHFHIDLEFHDFCRDKSELSLHRFCR